MMPALKAFAPADVPRDHFFFLYSSPRILTRKSRKPTQNERLKRSGRLSLIDQVERLQTIEKQRDKNDAYDAGREIKPQIIS